MAAGNGMNPFISAVDVNINIAFDNIEKEKFISDRVEENCGRYDEENSINVTSCATEYEFGGVTLDAIASKLLRDRFILTALEMHMELMESGHELSRLKDFFSNPANFERVRIAETSPPRLHRTSSIQTFDSLDFARYSDDGEKHENDKVAVLEFELRTAHDTIKSLRAALTKAAETEQASPEKVTDIFGEVMEDQPVQSFEKRALNFLINEYLLKNNYKLTSVTFSEENVNQDFEYWDDVGINIPKPPELVHLYRGYGGGHLIEKCNFECMTCMDDADLSNNILKLELDQQEFINKIFDLERELKEQQLQNMLLENQLKEMETERKYTADKNRNIANLSSSPSISFPLHQQSIAADIQIYDESWFPRMSEDHNNDMLNVEVEQHIANDDTLQEKFEPSSALIKDQQSSAFVIPAESNTGDSHAIDSHDHRRNTPEVFHDHRRNTPEVFQKLLMNTAFQVLQQDNRIVSEIIKVFESGESNCVTLMLGRCLPHIVPNILISKREELIPLIICAVSLHPDAAKRDELMNILFNLIKRPDPEQRLMILSGCIAFAQHVGPVRVETELLPQCWEQITHKYVERRLLVAEACGVLAPYIKNEMRGSLVLSMLQQMLEDKIEDVREAVVKSLGILVSFVDDDGKFQPTTHLLLNTLNDTSDRVIRAVEQVFVPSMAMWAMELSRLEMNFVQSFLDNIEKMVQQTNTSCLVVDQRRFSLCVQILQSLVSFLFVSVVSSGPFVQDLRTRDCLSNKPDLHITSRLPEFTSDLLDLSVIMGNSEKVTQLVGCFEEFISQEWHESWSTYGWVVGDFVPQLLNLSVRMDVSQGSVHQFSCLLHLFCRVFGHQFTMTKVRPRFEQILKLPEDHQNVDRLLAASNSPLNRSVVPVYAAGILTAFGRDEDKKWLTTFLQSMLSTLALHHSSLSSLQCTFTELSLDASYHELLLKVLWDGVVHTSALIRASSGRMFEFLIQGITENLVSTRVIPALVTLASDPEITVRIATIGAFGTIIECTTEKTILDKVYMQFQSFMDDPQYKDYHLVHIELIKTFGKIGPNAEPKFRDDFILPRLTALAVQNQLTTNEARKADVALQLFETYSAMSCCFISDQLVQEVMLPGLRCLHQDLQLVAPDHVHVVGSMIREFEDKVESNGVLGQSKHLSASASGAIASSSVMSTEAMKLKMLSRFKDVKDRASQSNFTKIFTAKK